MVFSNSPGCLFPNWYFLMKTKFEFQQIQSFLYWISEQQCLEQVKKVNGVEVENLKQLCRLVENCSEKFLRFDLDDEIVIVLNYQLATIASSRILKRHRIPSAMSIDLLDEAKDSTMGSAGVS